jgi:hypothetical protein
MQNAEAGPSIAWPECNSRVADRKIGLGAPMTLCTVPATSVVTSSGERSGIAPAIVTMVFTLSWAIGETFGAPGAAEVSHATSDAVPLAVLALLMVATLWWVRRASARMSSPLAFDAGSASRGRRSSEGESLVVEAAAGVWAETATRPLQLD